MSDPGLPVAGWYADPTGVEQLRWWGGLAWTEHVKPKPAPVPAPVPVPVAVPVPQAAAPAFNPSFGAVGAPGYVPFAVAYAPGPINYSPTGSANTLAVWLLALYPFYGILAQWLILNASANLDFVTVLAIPIALLIILVGSAIWDHMLLSRRGYESPSAAWILLGPIGYLIARFVTVKRTSAAPVAPGIVFALGVLVSAIFSFAVLAPMFLAQQNAARVTAFESQAEEQLLAQTQASWDVTCSREIPITVVGNVIPCSAADQTGQALQFTLTVLPNGQYQVSDPVTVPATSESS